jgi:hypothetical protein
MNVCVVTVILTRNDFECHLKSYWISVSTKNKPWNIKNLSKLVSSDYLVKAG